MTKAYADAVAKAYADTRLFRGGGTMTGDLQMTDNRITGLSDPVNNQDAATKLYVDTNRERLAISSSLGAIICKQPLLEVGDTLENMYTTHHRRNNEWGYNVGRSDQYTHYEWWSISNRNNIMW